jgi:hypothetical protein
MRSFQTDNQRCLVSSEARLRDGQPESDDAESFLFAVYRVPLGLPANRYLELFLGGKAIMSWSWQLTSNDSRG